MNPDVSIIIVSYNTGDVIAACLNSLLSDRKYSTEIFVVDNASSDESVELIKNNYPSVNLITNTENRGFAAANNQALQLCRGNYVFFLNPDTIVKSGSIERAVEFMETHPQIGLAGTKIVDQKGFIRETVAYQYPGQRYERTFPELIGFIASVSGASMFSLLSVIKKIGGFDEDYFLYGEEEDLCLRIRKLGFEIGYIENAVIVHLKGYSERQSTMEEVWKIRVASEYLFYKKHYSQRVVKRIAKINRLKALWRIVTISLTYHFLKDKKKAYEKLIKYRVTYDSTKCFL
jgi:N-acetylglucosaminyl-diphospho-decaprenol L-rhamnosyltransferase